MYNYPTPDRLCCLTVTNLLAAAFMFLMAPWAPAVGVGFTALCLIVAWPRPDTPENAALLRNNIWFLQGLTATLFLISVIMLLATFTPDGSEEADAAAVFVGISLTLIMSSCMLIVVRPFGHEQPAGAPGGGAAGAAGGTGAGGGGGSGRGGVV